MFCEACGCQNDQNGENCTKGDSETSSRRNVMNRNRAAGPVDRGSVGEEEDVEDIENEEAVRIVG